MEEIINDKKYKKLVWLYLILLFFEGALRKWFLPWFSTPLLLVREPIVVYLFIIGASKGWLNNIFIYLMIIASTISFIATLIIGHHNLFVGLYGFRIYAFDFPFIFIMIKVLTREDILLMGKFVLLLSIPMTIIIILQFYSSQSSWINRGIGGDTDGAGFSGANGYFRPSGVFSFTSGYILYQSLVASFLFFYILQNRQLPSKYKLSPFLLVIISLCFLMTIPFSISRSLLYYTLFLLFFLFIGGLIMNDFQKIKKFITIFILASLIITILLLSGFLNDSLNAITTRFTIASKIEGGNEGILENRVLGSFIKGLFPIKAPILGYGLGLGTNVGAKLLGGKEGMFSYFDGENEWGRITNESGMFLGWIIISIRIILSFIILKKSYLKLKYEKDILAWCFFCGVLFQMFIGQWGVQTNLGFSLIFTGFACVCLKDGNYKVA